MLRKIIIVQCHPGRQLSLEENLMVFKQRPDFVVLPEYYNVDPEQIDLVHNSAQAPQRLDYCQVLADRFGGTLIAGTAIEADGGRFYNTSTVYQQGEVIGHYRKINPTPNERRRGITPGKSAGLFEVDGVRISIMICADVLLPENFSKLAELKPDIIFVPTTSPLRPGEAVKDKYTRDQHIFVDGAGRSGSFVVKCCGVGELWGGQLQGRSLAAAPWGILSRVPPDKEEHPRIMSLVLDIAELREFRKKREAVSTNKR